MTVVSFRPLGWVGRALAAGALDEAACADVRRTLLALPAPAGLDRAVFEHERLVLIDGYIKEVADSIRAAGQDPAWHPANVALTAALREINARFDDMEARLRPTTAESLWPIKGAADELRAHIESMRDELESTSGMAEHALEALVSGGEHQGRIVGTVLAGDVLLAFPLVLEDSARVEAHRQLVLVALALRIHERRTDAFPATLEDLEPALLPDLSSGALDLASFTYECGEQSCSIECAASDETIEVDAGSR